MIFKCLSKKKKKEDSIGQCKNSGNSYKICSGQWKNANMLMYRKKLMFKNVSVYATPVSAQAWITLNDDVSRK